MQLKWAKKAEALGAGEILLTSMDCDGTKAGYDISLTSDYCRCGFHTGNCLWWCRYHWNIFTRDLPDGGADAVLAASLFHYKELEISQD